MYQKIYRCQCSVKQCHCLKRFPETAWMIDENSTDCSRYYRIYGHIGWVIYDVCWVNKPELGKWRERIDYQGNYGIGRSWSLRYTPQFD